MSRQLQRVWNSIPLSKFKQGSSLSINSPNPSLPLSVKIIPQWRDDALINLKQIFADSSEKEVDMKVEMSNDPADFQMTSLGRKAPIAKINLDWKKSNQNKNDSSSLKTSLTESSTKIQNNIKSKIAKMKEDELPAYGFVNNRDGYSFTSPLSEDVYFDEDKVDDVSNSSIDSNCDNGKTSPSIELTAKLPQQSNITCHIAGIGGIHIESKLEGDVILSAERGDITTHQLRGYHFDIRTKKGNILSSKNMEAQTIHLNIEDYGRIKAKMLNGSNIFVNAPLRDCCNDNLNTHIQQGKQQNNNDDLSLSDEIEDDALALVDISSLYTTQTGDGAHIHMKPPGSDEKFTKYNRHVHVKSHHGHITIHTTQPPQPKSNDFISIPTIRDKYNNIIPHVELGGMNGSCDICIHPNSLNTEINEKQNISETYLAARVHVDSLAPNTISVLTANRGNISITYDRKIETDLCAISTPFISSLDVENIIQIEDATPEALYTTMTTFNSKIIEKKLSCDRENRLSSDAQQNNQKLHIDTDAFVSYKNMTCEIKDLQHVQYEFGEIRNNSEEPDSRFDMQTKGISSKRGKINVENAASQALQGFTKIDHNEWKTSSSALYYNSNENFKNEENDKLTNHESNDPAIGPDKNDQKSGRIYDWPFMIIATNGMIQVETVNWFGAIARRFGMDETSRKKESLGRQARKSVK